MKKGKLIQLSAKEASDFLLPKHYSGRKPQISKAFGWMLNEELVAVCTFGKPASHSLCIGVCGEEHESSVYELNRLCRISTLTEPLSMFVAACLKELKKNNWIVVSYSDTAMNHHGFIYQACNFIYTGMTKERTDKYTGEKHARHYDKGAAEVYRQIRSAKHRYIYFCTNDNKLKKQWCESLKYKVQQYPKGQNQNYVLGDYIKPQIIKIFTKVVS